MEGIYGSVWLLAFLTLCCWVPAAVRIGGVARAPSADAVRRRARRVRRLLLGGYVTLAGYVALAVALSTWGWAFAADLVLVALPPVVLPALAAVPAVARLSGPAPGDRRAVAAGEVVVPVQLAGVGSVLSGWYAGRPPTPSYRDDAALALALTVAAGLLLTARRRRAAAGGRVGVPGRAAAAALVAAVGLAGVAYARADSRLPDRYPMAGHGHGHGVGTSVADLTGPRTGAPDRRYTLRAARTRVRLAAGEQVDAWTFNGTAPGPELRVRQGELVEVTLVNEDVTEGVTVHWHGVNVPNAEDGVAGVTQDAVRPGGRHVYRFRPPDAGTFWYHSHQQSDPQVRRGLFGALVVEPRGGAPAGRDVIVLAHGWPTADGVRAAFGAATRTSGVRVAPGTRVRVRVVNADNGRRVFRLAGTRFRLVAIDGHPVNRPPETTAQVPVAGGGRIDLAYLAPAGDVRLTVTEDGNDGEGGSPTLLLGPGAAPGPAGPPAGAGSGEGTRPGAGILDPAAYGVPAPAPFGPDSDPDSEHTMLLGNRMGFHDGRFGFLYTINSEVAPRTPAIRVRAGELVGVTFVNRSFADHPMHLHGHTVQVVERNGRRVTGSPWWTDTLNVAPGETYEVLFRADNPGLWMDHCHNLAHAASGMATHVVYAGVSSPFQAGPATGNVPE